MPNLSFAEVSAASRNAMLSAKVSKAIRHARKGVHLDPHEKAILVRGANLLSEVVQGSLLVERKPLEQGCHADLKAYRHALSALAQLQREMEKDGTQKMKDVTRVFKGYREDISGLSEGAKVSEKHLGKLEEFFKLLSEFFFRDIQAPLPVQQEPFRAMLS